MCQSAIFDTFLLFGYYILTCLAKTCHAIRPSGCLVLGHVLGGCSSTQVIQHVLVVLAVNNTEPPFPLLRLKPPRLPTSRACAATGDVPVLRT